ncbi:MAG: DUF4173 domain-containing protein [Flammeovirgaceae bacterium]
MKNPASIKLALTGVGALLFNALFWEETLGLNTLIFALFITGGLFYIHRKEKLSNYAILMGLTTLFSAGMVVVNYSFPARLALIISSILMIGFLHHHSLRSILYAASGAFSSLLKVPKQLITSVRFTENTRKEWYRGIRYVQLFVIPTIVAIVFLFIFRAANPVFNAWTNSFFDFIGIGLENLFTWLSPVRLIFVLLGAILTSWAFFAIGHPKITAKEAAQSDEVLRKRRKFTKTSAPFTAVSLKNENRTGAILMAMVSVMATMVNAIDISHVWFNFEYDSSMNLSQFVHEGTYLLILSILLSMGIMLYYFRGNQNFYLKNTRIKWLAHIWIVQNVIMVISVAIRNYHYIHYHGLAYKRIGVIFFLGLTLFGLWTLFIKIKAKKSAFFLLRTNSWATYVMVLMLASINWDLRIAEYNITHWNKAHTDVDFLLSLSDKALPILDQHREVFIGHQVPAEKAWANPIPATMRLDQRIQSFVDNTVHYSWLSWNWPEDKAFNHFNAQGITVSIKE